MNTWENHYSKIYCSKYFIELNFDKSTQYVALWTHKRHPIPRPFGRAMECLLWVLEQKLIVLYRVSTVYYPITTNNTRGIYISPKIISRWVDVLAELRINNEDLGWRELMLPSPNHFCHQKYGLVSYVNPSSAVILTHWGRDKMDTISQTTFLSAFSWMKMFEFQLKIHWSLFVRV